MPRESGDPEVRTRSSPDPTEEVRALTVRQPWGWAIAYGGKTVENRSWTTRWRGILYVHAGAGLDRERLPSVASLTGRPQDEIEAELVRGAIVATARLADVHACDGSCSPWATPGSLHWVLADVRPLGAPVPATGAQRLWQPSPELLHAVAAARNPPARRKGAPG